MTASVFTVPAGASFVDTIAAGLIDRYAGPPERLAEVLVLVPTRRAVKSLREAFLRQSEGRPLILPRLRPLGDVDEDELALASLVEAESAADLAPAIVPLRRRLLLARRIRRAAGTFGPVADEQAAQLADALAAFLDEVDTAEADMAKLDGLVEGELSEHWQTTLAFLRAVTADWPEELQRMGALEPARRRRLLIDGLAAQWSAMPPRTPVIAAGSTGTIPATARLLACIAALPQGAVVLPGLDLDMSEEAWEQIEESHPQHALKGLIARLGVNRAEVAEWPAPADALLPQGSTARRHLLSAALLPAEATAGWPDLPPPPPEAVEGLAVAACANPHVEAQVAALRMRMELARPGRTVALVTRDRELARRVAAELRRWEIEVDDSAGEPLALTRSGAFLRLIAAAVAERLAPVPLLALLKHPLTRLGAEAGATRAAVRRLELAVLRGPRPAPGIAGLRHALAGGRDDTPELAALIAALEAALGPLIVEAARPQVPLGRLVEAHVAAAQALVRGATDDGAAALWGGDDGEALNGFVAELVEHAESYGLLDPRAWPALLDTLMGGRVVRPRYGRHPRAFIWGPLEARMQHADCVILGGLVEASWPPEPPSDPWMSRPMRRDFGLPAPEQRIGQAAHDFVQAAAAGSVLLLHSERAAGAPCVPARWIVRLQAFLDAKGLDAEPWQGAVRWRVWQARLDRPPNVEPARAPRPTPPVEVRPDRLSVTEVGTWLADPYAIYARRVLELEPLDELDEDASAAVRGTFVHRALERFVTRFPDALPDDAVGELIAIGEEEMSGPLDRPAVRAIWWRRFERIAAWFIGLERERRQGLAAVHAERRGSLSFAAAGGRPFTLIAKADRLEIDRDGAVHVVDYKTGTVPSGKEVASGRAPQLPLEAAIVKQGGFPDIAAAPVAEIAHWKLSGGEPAGEVKPVPTKGTNPDDIADQALAGLQRLVGVFEAPETPYLDHPGGAGVGPWDAYIDVARTLEWRLGPDIMMPDLPPHPVGSRPLLPRSGNDEQQRMSDPTHTVWVAASAGTGKTKVLTDRVLRLLLQDTPPSRILCLTFTKAAAAEMAIRVRRELSLWLALDDAALAEDLRQLTGRAASDEEMRRARRLFARVLDAPGGLPIATIHSFCQSLLARFPLEAGVPPRFALIEERGGDELLHDARERVLARIVEARDDRLAAELDALALRAGESRVADLIAQVCGQGRRFARARRRHGSVEGMIAAARRALGLGEEETRESVIAEACRLDPDAEAALHRAAAALADSSKSDIERAERMAPWLDADTDRRATLFDDYARAFLTDRRLPRSTLATKAVREADPAVLATLEAEQARIIVVDERLRAVETAARTAALLRLGDAVLEEFRRMKDDRAVLDYDDLIEKAQQLLRREGIAPWVLFKLDGGIDHVLVDEAQDTNPSQWDVVLSLTEEFFAGEGASETVRTLFVVGDEKQSIFSFQGADLEALREVHAGLRARVEAAAGAWLELPLITSYRSVSAVLDVVDEVFADPAAAEGVNFGDTPIEHGTVRSEDAGLVELWPPVGDDEKQERDIWLAPIEEAPSRDRHSKLAAAIAATIARLAGEDAELLESRGTPIRPGDIMILVRKRSDVVDALVRELRSASIPVAGVDRMDLTAQVVVRDLMALGRFCLMPEDDVALAAVLKGPFVDFDDDLLMTLAHGRPRRDVATTNGTSPPEPLWHALRARRGESDAFGRAHGWLAELLALADQMAPVEFLGHVLIRPAATQDGFGGRKALVRRLGLEAQDPLDELINLAFAFEREHAPSLEGFLWWLGSGSAEVKREPEGAGDAVRIMTVHGAKGLQAPVVFLIDDIGAGNRRGDDLLWDDERDLALWPGSASGRDALSRRLYSARQAREQQEERRLLYVAMTRARDRLYVCASQTAEDKQQSGWHALVRRGMEGLAERFAFEAPAGGWSGEGLRLKTAQIAPVAAPEERRAAAAEPPELPEAAHLAMTPEKPTDRPLSPSRLPGAEPPPPSPLAAAVDDSALRRGRLVHRLLELLPDLDPATRLAAALRLIRRHAPETSEEVAGRLAREVVTIIEKPSHSMLFAPGSRAEVSIAGRIGDAVIAGQVDRLVVTDDAVMIVDYKTGAAPAGGPDTAPEAYLRQLAAYAALLAEIYPGRRLSCALLWTDEPRFMEVPGPLLERFGPPRGSTARS